MLKESVEIKRFKTHLCHFQGQENDRKATSNINLTHLKSNSSVYLIYLTDEENVPKYINAASYCLQKFSVPILL